MMSLTKFLRALRLTAFCLAVPTLMTAAPAQAAVDSYAQTRYPIVLVHGMAGFNAIGPIDYFYGVANTLRNSGATVYTPAVSAFNSSEVRGEELLAYLRNLQAAYGYTKFNLVGHSHGGQTIRYVAAVAPDLVASITTVGAPHQGSVVADLVASATSATGTTSFAAGVSNLLGQFISFMSGSPDLPQDSLGTLISLSTAGAQAFNAKFAQGAPTAACGQGAATVNNVRYYSSGGAQAVTNVFDISDMLLGFTSLAFPTTDNDGLVSRCSSHWGVVLRDDYPWNHLDEINHVFGLRGAFSPDPVQFYRTQANRLKLAGL